MRIGVALKVVLFLLILFSCTTAGSIYYMQRVLVDNYLEYRKEELVMLAFALDDAIGDMAADAAYEENDRNIDILASQTTGRVIVSDLSGRIFYDSKHTRTGSHLDRKGELRIGKGKRAPALLIRMPNELDTVYYPASELHRYEKRIDDISLLYFFPLHGKNDLAGQIMIEERVLPLESALSGIRDRLILFMGCVFMVMAAAAFVTVQRGIVRPMNSVSSVAKKVAAGDLSDRVKFHSNDEIGGLSREFNTMIYGVEKWKKELEEKMDGIIHMSRELESRNDELNRKQKLIDFDLRLAHNVQQELLPQTYPRLDGVTISAANFQVGEIGGDCFDFYKLDDHRIGAFIGDVSGKGIAAALVMSMVTILFSQLVNSMDSTAKVLGKINEIMYRHFGSRHSIYLTCFFLTLDTETMTLNFSCAGHNPPILYRHSTGELSHLESEGFGLGMFSKVIYEEKSAKVQPGDKVILFTDGVVDSRNPQGGMFGLERLKETIKANADANCFRMTHLIVEEIEAYAAGANRQDNLTIIILDVLDLPGGAA